MSEWTDRFLAGCGGAAALMAWNYYVSGDIIGGTVGLVLVGVAVWLCAPSWPRRAPVGYILSQDDRQRFVRELSAVYGATNQDEYPAWRPVDSWDPFGTPIKWCGAYADHDAHLWPIHGPRYAPVLCMGHDCLTPHVHLPEGKTV